jgi:hypothetical protein
MKREIKKFFEDYISGHLKKALIVECILPAVKLITNVSLSNTFGGIKVTLTAYYKTFEAIDKIISPIWDFIGTLNIILLIITLILLWVRKYISKPPTAYM